MAVLSCPVTLEISFTMHSQSFGEFITERIVGIVSVIANNISSFVSGALAVEDKSWQRVEINS